MISCYSDIRCPCNGLYSRVAKSIRMNSIISTIQAVLLIVCTLPMRVYQMERRFMEWQECDTNTEDCFFDARKYSHVS